MASYSLDRQIEAYEEMREFLEAKHFRKWVVFYNGELVDTYDSFEEAADDAVPKFGRGPYLIRQVGAPQEGCRPPCSSGGYMPTISAGFDDLAGIAGWSDLVQFGPTIQVQIGFDSAYTPANPTRPNLPQATWPALIDTGATESCIDSALAAQLALPVVDRTPHQLCSRSATSFS